MRPDRCCARDGVYGTVVSHPLLFVSMLYVFSFSCSVGITQLVSEFLSVRIVSSVVLDTLLPGEEVWFRSLLQPSLQSEPLLVLLRHQMNLEYISLHGVKDLTNFFPQMDTC